MSTTAHLDSLHEKHTEIKQNIKYAYDHHLPDNEISQLKRQKLKLKDEIKIFADVASRASNQNIPAG